jgi:hypothetical protein
LANLKVAAVSPAVSAREAAVGAASQQAIDSTKALSRADQAFERKVQQQVQSAPTPPRIIPEQQQQQAGAARAPAPSPAPLANRNRSEVDAAFGAGLRVARGGPVAGACYGLRLLTPNDVRGPITLADTVRLLDEVVPERSDPSWRRARAVGASAGVAELAWRMVDSVTVELRTRSASDTSAVRFNALAAGVAVPAPAAMPPGVRAALAARVVCP